MTQWSIVQWVVLAVWMVALPAWAVEYRLQIANLEYLTLSSYDNGSGNVGRLETRLDTMEFPAGAVIPGREVQLLEDPAYGGNVPDRLSILPTTREQAWTTLIWQGNPGDTVVFVVKSDMAAWQRVRMLAANPEGTLRRLTLGGPSLFGGLSYEVPEVSYDFLANTVDQRGFPQWVAHNARTLNGMALVIGQGRNVFYNPDRVYIVLRTPPEPHVFKVVIGWRDHDDRGTGTKDFPSF
ncbi:MAG TPA: hypothetical protein VNP04_09540 [Alphaproteobacteria bacterium]|nr:hypothetical protein [Alphaproteobacteria bacterium]